MLSWEMIQQLALNVSVEHECYPQLAQYGIGVVPIPEIDCKSADLPVLAKQAAVHGLHLCLDDSHGIIAVLLPKQLKMEVSSMTDQTLSIKHYLLCQYYAATARKDWRLAAWYYDGWHTVVRASHERVGLPVT